MKCEHKIIDFNGLSSSEIIRILEKERNEFAKSRQEWIQAAFDLYAYEDSFKFRMMLEELCESCKKQYRNNIHSREI